MKQGKEHGERTEAGKWYKVVWTSLCFGRNDWRLKSGREGGVYLQHYIHNHKMLMFCNDDGLSSDRA